MKTTHYEFGPNQEVILHMHIGEAVTLLELVRHRLAHPIIHRPIRPLSGWEPVDHLRHDLDSLRDGLVGAIRETDAESAREMGI